MNNKVNLFKMQNRLNNNNQAMHKKLSQTNNSCNNK